MSRFRELYSEYVKEREGCKLVVVDDGFISFKVNETNGYGTYIFINDFFVSSKGRKKKKHTAVKMLSVLREQAKELGCRDIRGTIYTNTLNATESLKACLYYGFEIASTVDNRVNIITKLDGDLKFPAREQKE